MSARIKFSATDACCDVVCTFIEKTDDGRIKCGTGMNA